MKLLSSGIGRQAIWTECTAKSSKYKRFSPLCNPTSNRFWRSCLPRGPLLSFLMLILERFLEASQNSYNYKGIKEARLCHFNMSSLGIALVALGRKRCAGKLKEFLPEQWQVGGCKVRTHTCWVYLFIQLKLWLQQSVSETGHTTTMFPRLILLFLVLLTYQGTMWF